MILTTDITGEKIEPPEGPVNIYMAPCSVEKTDFASIIFTDIDGNRIVLYVNDVVESLRSVI